MIEKVKQHLILYENRLEHNHCSPVIDYPSNLGSVSVNLVANEVQNFSSNAKFGNQVVSINATSYNTTLPTTEYKSQSFQSNDVAAIAYYNSGKIQI